MILLEPPSEQVRLLRERAGLTVEELADAAALDVERLREIEAGAVDPGVTEFHAIANATGHQSLVCATRELREDADERVVGILHQAVSKLLAVTEPPCPLPVLGLSGWRRGALGLFLVARESVREMLLLDVLGHSYHAGPLIDRSVFEDVATAIWAADDSTHRETRFHRLVQDRNFYLEKLAERDPDGWGPICDGEKQAWSEAGFAEEDFSSRLPPFEQRLAGGMEAWYPRYRRLSLFLHPNIARIEDAFEDTRAGTCAKVEVVSDPRDLAFAATLVWGLALRIEHDWGPGGCRTGLGFVGEVDDFTELGLVLNTFTRDESVTPDSAIYIPGPDDVGR